ncbi:glycoside hydrolase family 3 C-terminal domain-containing protein [Jiangella endophytica]|uniref:glycoside hydrolase family 3 C-terminal domain-containing protein n=1 Tax=Jiangella endophytica TaxID=1623398 RepID=UPI000E34395C|nr:glycoside hydrolase family 3 C-terminal domain-containing protein [Jiangella endophytica]
MDDLLAKLTLEQKVRLLTGTDSWHLRAEPAIGLRTVVLTDGPAGVRAAHRGGAVTALNLPSGTALGASWDVELAERFGAVLAAETRRVGADVLLGPTVNLHRSPLGGRHFEAYSEDPLLTSRLAAAYVRGVQNGGVGACPKHYVGNDAETERLTVDVVVGERTLRELYLAAFEDTVVEERPWMVMAAYNSVNGATMTENPLLAEPLCGEWGFDGVVVSDWGAARTTSAAGRARLDLVMPGPAGPWGDALVDAVRAGSVPEEAVDEKVRRLLRLAARVGALDAVTARPSPVVDGVAFAREAAAEGMVLLRNAGGELPWDAAELRSVAVIGPAAVLARTQGGGSAYVEPERVVSPLDGLRAALPGVDVRWSLGARVRRGLVALPPADLTDPETGEPGVRLVVRSAGGTVLRSERYRSAELTRLGSRRLAGAASVELAAVYRPVHGGVARLGVAAGGRVRLTVDGATVLDTVLEHDGTAFAGGLVAPPVASVEVDLVADRPVDVVARLDLPAGDHTAGTLVVGTDPAGPDTPGALADAVAAARGADAVLVVVGTGADDESESFDRATLALPGGQDDLVRAVAAANPRTVVAVTAGAPVLLPWRDDVAAVLLTWFGGQELGHALADVLLGVREPGGRLPTTWPAAERDVPVLSTTPVEGRLPYDEAIHVGHRAWLRAGAVPAYPFGSGLGYTTWSLGAPRVAAAGDGGVDVVLPVRNTGGRPGKHVVQAYLSRPGSAVERPVRWLAGFAVVRADAGETAEAGLRIGRRAFAHWAAGGWAVEPGPFTLHVGPHVDDLPLWCAVTPAAE